MTEIKYVAAGFLEDAEKLLDDFIQENSTKFSVFACVWRKRNFSFIYMGRGSEEELRDFTQEIFNLTTQFLASGPLVRQVGTVYLLYSLYRNQILSPPVRIRVVLDHMKFIEAIRDELPLDEHKTFHYVFSYLMKNSFDFVACPKLMGPTVPSLVADTYQGATGNSILKYHTGLKSDMTEMAESKVLKETSDMFAKYIDMKTSLNLNVRGIGSDTVKMFENFSTRLSSLLDRSKTTLPVLVRKEPPTSDIGSRRVYLKSKAFGESLPEFQREQICYQSNDEEYILDVAIDKPLPLRKRFPKPRRNVGRPKKVDKDNEDVSLDVKRQRRRLRKPRQRTCTSMRHYYSESEDLKLLSNYENRSILNNEDARLFTDNSDVDSETGVDENLIKTDTDCEDLEPAITSHFVEDVYFGDPEPASQFQNDANPVEAIKKYPETATESYDSAIHLRIDPESVVYVKDI